MSESTRKVLERHYNELSKRRAELEAIKDRSQTDENSLAVLGLILLHTRSFEEFIRACEEIERGAASWPNVVTPDAIAKALNRNREL